MNTEDYAAVAEILRVARNRALSHNRDGAGDGLEAVNYIALEIVHLCEKQNSRFDRWEFGRAADISEDNLDQR